MATSDALPEEVTVVSPIPVVGMRFTERMRGFHTPGPPLATLPAFTFGEEAMKQPPASLRSTLVLSVLLCVPAPASWARTASPESASSSTALATPPPVPSEEWPGMERLPSKQVRAMRVGLGPDFSPGQHRQALKDLKGLHRTCTEEMMRAQWHQDIVHQLQSKAHFDNCNFDEGVAYIDQLLADARDESTKGEPMAALFKLGQAVHGLQDFYSHTDYIERMARAHERFEDVPVVAVWTEEGKNTLRGLVSQGLQSGRVVWNGPQKCDEKVPTHGELAKDTPKHPAGKVVIPKWGSRTQHQAASELSDKATKAFIRFALEQMPAVKDSCGGVTGIRGQPGSEKGMRSNRARAETGAHGLSHPLIDYTKPNAFRKTGWSQINRAKRSMSGRSSFSGIIGMA